MNHAEKRERERLNRELSFDIVALTILFLVGKALGFWKSLSMRGYGGPPIDAEFFLLSLYMLLLLDFIFPLKSKEKERSMR